MEQPVILIDGGTPHRPTPQEPSPPREHPSPPSYPQFLSPDHALSPVQRVGSLLSPGSRSRTSSRVKKGGRPGTAAVQPSRPPSTTPEPTLRRVQSLDDSILPSHRARSLTAEDDETHHVDLIGRLPGAESPTSSEGSPSSTLAALPCVSDAPSGSSGKHGSESWLRLWHMFMELLVTERSYLYDLRILVHVYLEELPKYVTLAAAELEHISRNAGQLLSLHESLSVELLRIENTMRETFHRTSLQQKTERLGKGLTEAADILISAFMLNDLEIYQTFCAAHPEALSIVRSLQSHPEWDSYEQRCSMLATGPVFPEPAVRRRYSAESVRTMANAHQSSHVVPTSRLKFMDFLIKPVQRICKYPLILAQIRQGAEAAGLQPTREADPCGRLELAYAAMETAARRVDDARKYKELTTISRLILSRMEPHATLTPEFVSLLGVCSLSGSLEVVYHHSILAPLRPPIKSRYYAAFLYQGYFILSKVKKGPVYEPRHWFPIHQIEFHDLPDPVAVLPTSFRLSCGLHHFELGTRSRAEKDVWLEAISQARIISSLKAEQLEPVTTLLSATNASQLSLETDEMGLTAFLAEGTNPVDSVLLLNDLYDSKGQLQRGSGSLGSSSKRRSSLFSSESAGSIIRRPSSAHRLFVEKNLVDIVFNARLRARATGLTGETTQGANGYVGGRSKSWGKATNVLGRTPSVASVFNRRSVAYTVDEGSVDEPVSRRSSCASDSPTRSKLVFPPVGVSLGRRRRLAGGPTLTIPTNEAEMAEVDENRSEGAATPDSSAFPLTPEGNCFQDSLPAVSAASPEAHEQYLVNQRIPSPPNGSFYKHSRTRSHGSRALFSSKTGVFSMTDELGRASMRMTPISPPGQPSIVAQDHEPQLRDGESSRSLLQRGVAYVLRRRTATILAGDAPRISIDGPVQVILPDQQDSDVKASEATASGNSDNRSSISWRRARVRSAPLEATLQNAAQS